MNIPTKALIDEILVLAGSSSLALGNGSIGLIAAPFAPSPTLTLASITEATFSGYARQGYGNPSVPFTGADGNEYVQGNTVQFLDNATTTVNTIYGLFVTNGHDSTTLIDSDQFATPIFMNGPSSQITITPRFGINPLGGLGLNVVSD